MVSFLRWLTIFASCFPAKIEIVDLGSEIFSQFAGQTFECRRFLGEIFLALLQFGNIRVDGDRSVIQRAAFADHHPQLAGTPLHLRRAGVAMLRQALSDPFLDPAFGIRHVAALGGATDDAFKTHSG